MTIIYNFIMQDMMTVGILFRSKIIDFLIIYFFIFFLNIKVIDHFIHVYFINNNR